MGAGSEKDVKFIALGLEMDIMLTDYVDGKTTINTPVYWQCQEHSHRFSASYNELKKWGACPVCHPQIVNGVTTSLPQRRLQQLLGGQLNYPYKGYSIDLVLILEGKPIAIEYDGAYWHPEPNPERDHLLLANGWSILRIRAKSNIPPCEQIEQALNLLLEGNIRLLEITLQEAL